MSLNNLSLIGGEIFPSPPRDTQLWNDSIAHGRDLRILYSIINSMN